MKRYLIHDNKLATVPAHCAPEHDNPECVFPSCIVHIVYFGTELEARKTADVLRRLGNDVIEFNF